MDSYIRLELFYLCQAQTPYGQIILYKGMAGNTPIEHTGVV